MADVYECPECGFEGPKNEWEISFNPDEIECPDCGLGVPEDDL